jgi:trehalose-6-phosphate synthase
MSSRVSSTLVGFHRTSKRLGFSASCSGFLERYFSEEKRDRERERKAFSGFGKFKSASLGCVWGHQRANPHLGMLSSVKHDEDS